MTLYGLSITKDNYVHPHIHGWSITARNKDNHKSARKFSDWIPKTIFQIQSLQAQWHVLPCIIGMIFLHDENYLFDLCTPR